MFALPAVVLAASALLAPPPDPMTIDVLSATGTGCDANTSAVGMSIDNTAFTVVFSNFAVLGHGQEAKKDCTITLRVNHPDGFTFGIAQVDYRGFAHLESGAHGFQDSTYHFTGLPTRHSKQKYDGPMDGDWQVTDQPEAGAVLHGPCKEHRPLTITTELKVNGKSDGSFMTMDSADSNISEKFILTWTKC